MPLPFSDQSAATPWQTSPAGLEAQINGTTLATVEGAAWRDLFVQSFIRKETQPPFLVPAVAEPLIVWIISGEAQVEEREVGGKWSSAHVTENDFFLTHSATPYEMRWQTRSEKAFRVMHLYLSIALLDRVSQAQFGLDISPGLREISGGRDETVSQLMRLLLAAAQQSATADPLFVEGLAQSLAAHVVRKYADPGAGTRVVPALPGNKLRSACSFMKARLAEPFDLAGTAQAAGLSPFHFSRLFKRATGLSPSQHFIRERIEESRRLLRETRLGVTQIGMAVGYNSPSHFAQIFRREVGVSPRRYRAM